MNHVSRQIEIELTAQQGRVWDDALQHCRISGIYYDSPVFPVANGKAALGCSDDIVLAMIAALEEIPEADKKLGEQIIQKLVQQYAQEKIF